MGPLPHPRQQVEGEYDMTYEGTCLLLVVCFGPGAEVRNLQSGAKFGGFELGEGEAETHTFNGGPGSTAF